MVDRLVAVNDDNYRLPEPVLMALGSDLEDAGTGVGSVLASAVGGLTLRADGGTSDSAANLNTLFADAASGQKKVTLRGDYRIDSTVTIPDNITVDGHGARIYSTSHISMLSAGSNVEIDGLEIEGAGNTTFNGAGRGIVHGGASAAAYSTGLTVKNCKIHNLGYGGIVLRYADSCVVDNSTIENIGYVGVLGLSVSNVTVKDSGIHYITPGSTNAYGVLFTHASGNLAVDPRSRNCVAENNVIEDIPLWDALNTHSGEGIRFVGNTVRRCKRAASFVGSFSLYAPQHCEAIGNKAYGTTDEAINVVGAGTVVGTSIEAADSCVISENYIEDCGSDVSNNGGMVFYFTRTLSVKNNRIVRPRRSGINFYHTNIGFTSTGNTIIDPHSASLTTAPCIYFQSQYNTGVVGGNAFLRVDAGLDTYVGTRGVRAETMTNNNIVIQPNYSTTSLDYAGVSGVGSSWGDIGTGAKIYTSTTTPEGAVSGGVGSLCIGTGGATPVLYLKESGTSTTGWQPVASNRTATTANLTSAAHAVNAVGKVAGRSVFNTTTGKPVYATGPLATDVWNDATGTLAHTPA